MHYLFGSVAWAVSIWTAIRGLVWLVRGQANTAGEGKMLKGEEQLQLAALRIELRAIDAEIAGLRRESQRYRQMRFGLDIKDIQLTALQDQRDACAERLAELRKRLGLANRREHPLAWLLLPFVLWLRLRKMLAAAGDEAARVPAQPVEPAVRQRLDRLETTALERIAVGARR